MTRRTYQQFFRCKPDESFVNELLSCFTILPLGSEISIDSTTLCAKDTINKVNALIPELSLYYKSWKAEQTLPISTIKHALLILRHYVTQVGYSMECIKKVKDNNRIWRIVKIAEKKKNSKFIVSLFD